MWFMIFVFCVFSLYEVTWWKRENFLFSPDTSTEEQFAICAWWKCFLTFTLVISSLSPRNQKKKKKKKREKPGHLHFTNKHFSRSLLLAEHYHHHLGKRRRWKHLQLCFFCMFWEVCVCVVGINVCFNDLNWRC